MAFSGWPLLSIAISNLGLAIGDVQKPRGPFRLPSTTSGSKTPYELWNGRTPSLSMLCTWGCEALVHCQKDQRAPLGAHAKRCVFLGYPVDYKGWLFLDLSTGKEVISDSAVFNESVFNL